MPIDLDSEFTLHESSRYPTPRDGKAIIPLVYGEWLSAAVVPTDDEDGGYLPAVEIDRLNWVFALNGKASPNVAPRIYVGDQLQVASVYTFTAATDYAAIGWPITTLMFLVNPGSSQVSWRGQGTRDPAGLLIDNPVAGIMDAFITVGSWSLQDFDLPICYETQRQLTTVQEHFHWVFNQQRTYREWLNEIAKCYHLDIFETEAGKLAIQLDRAIRGLSQPVLKTIHAPTEVEASEDDVEYEVDEVNIINTLITRRRLKWTTMEYTDEPGLINRASVNLYGTLLGEIELPAVYTDAHTSRWAEAYLQRYGFLPAIVRFTVRGLSTGTALPGTYLGFEWPWFGWTQPRLLKVLNQEVDPFGQRIAYECFDCQRFVEEPVSLPSLPLTPIRRRPRAPDVSVDLVPPAAATNVTASGSYRRIVVRWTAPRDLDYRYTEIWRSQTNDRATAIHVRSGGTGAPGQTYEEAFDVIEGETWYVWLMTVDQRGNGKDGGALPSGGNWAPLSPTAGVSATSALIDTAAVAPEAVTVVYPTGITFPGLKQGHSIAAATHVPAQPPSGSFIVWATALVEINSQCTLAAFIQQGSTVGPTLGQTHTFNSFAGNATFGIIVPGAHFNPVFGVDYLLTLRSLNPQGLDFQFIVQNASLQVQHTKR